MRKALLIALVLSATGCQPGPREIQFGLERCAHCKMVIDDDRFASQLVTSKGKVYSFDSVECMIQHESDQEVASRWVWSRPDGGQWKNVEDAKFIQSPNIQSPMGGNIILADNADAGTGMPWTELVALVESRPQ